MILPNIQGYNEFWTLELTNELDSMLEQLGSEELPPDFPVKPEVSREIITSTKSYVEFDEEVVTVLVIIEIVIR